MTALGILLLGILLFVIPTIVGSCFATVDKDARTLPFMWISGQCVLWAGFQLMCVPLILLEKSFLVAVGLFSGYMALLVVLAILLYLKGRNKYSLRVVKEKVTIRNKYQLIAWGLFWALLVFQLIQAVVMTYGDGDDAFFVAAANIAEESELMYQKIPYTGETSELDARHGMAPFPIWIAYLARVSGIPTVSVAHVVAPLALIPMTYAIYYLLGKRFLGKKKESLPVFLIFTELLVLFGDYSFYTVENFMIARSRQGKAALGSIIIPMLFWILLILMEKLEEKQKLSVPFWILLAGVMTAGCLCSTLGALLVCMLIGLAGLCAAFCYRRWKILLPMAACCIPCVIYAGVYLILG
ncbi:MAG: hypothetical protein IJF07_01145 [Lachnospiraceae bacterium]|nr:hypothetical protein [Lachnospiraceae bacterium]